MLTLRNDKAPSRYAPHARPAWHVANQVSHVHQDGDGSASLLGSGPTSTGSTVTTAATVSLAPVRKALLALALATVFGTGALLPAGNGALAATAATTSTTTTTTAPAAADTTALVEPILLAQAQPKRIPSEEEISRFMVRLFQAIADDQEMLDAVIAKAYGTRLSPDKLEVARRMMRSNLTDPRIGQHVASVAAPFVKANPNATESQLSMVGMEAMSMLQSRGLKRLSPENQAFMVQHVIGLARGIPVSTCKRMGLEQIGTEEAAQIERSYVANLPLGRFEAVTNLYDAAMKAEIRGYPDVRTITPEQAQLAESVYEQALRTRFSTDMTPAQIGRVIDNMAAAPAPEVCAFLVSTMAAVLDMPEPFKTWQLVRFVEGMQ